MASNPDPACLGSGITAEQIKFKARRLGQRTNLIFCHFRQRCLKLDITIIISLVVISSLNVSLASSSALKIDLVYKLSYSYIVYSLVVVRNGQVLLNIKFR